MQHEALKAGDLVMSSSGNGTKLKIIAIHDKYAWVHYAPGQEREDVSWNNMPWNATLANLVKAPPTRPGWYMRKDSPTPSGGMQVALRWVEDPDNAGKWLGGDYFTDYKRVKLEDEL